LRLARRGLRGQARMGGESVLLGRYRHFLLDCDGVVWHSANAIAGAREAVKAMQERDADVVFVTNNATKTRKAYVWKGRAGGLGARGLGWAGNGALTGLWCT